ncbi:YfhO family protein [Ichthyenterobacterium sp. W332]|uniref:YfhO family protein n=1 Tax=Microcosmobacter mediterraneus TaxID=3075607 RepID=A0ABU2YGT7_9FLAO|nr:YfhO family protein [Ichthyenterobacterium sp. W332]MDT0557391.1 YfhO family protein [Ichthyenterobacterium sp. W332]
MFLKLKNLLPHTLVILGFVVIALAYFHPVLSGKQIFQNDIKHYIGMAQQQKEYKAETGKETYWTNSAFGGMPTYQLGARYPHNYIKKLDSVLRFLPRPADYLFLYFIGFYILFLALKVDYRIGALGALAFGFSTYLIIILGVGHNSKAHAIAYMPLVLGGILLAFQKRYILGFLVTAVAMALEIGANHFQMTYYLMLLVLIIGFVYLLDAYKKKELPHFFKTVGVLMAAVVLSIGLNATNIMATQEYVKESTRGKSELTINADGSKKIASSGLSKDYITEYSYGQLESLNLFIPRFMGGGTYENVGKNSETYSYFKSIGATPVQSLNEVRQTPTYWGEQPIVEGPAYVGAVILFLFVFALFLVRGRLKWWLLGGVLLSLFLSWGKNLGFLTNFFIDYIPLYNKFRAVSSIQVILELCVPILAMFGLVRLFNDFEKNDEKLKALKYTFVITVGLALLFTVFGSSIFDFVSPRDGRFVQMYGEIGPEYIDNVRKDRASFFFNDSLRTLILVVLSAGLIFLFLKKKLSENLMVVAFGLLIVFDLVGVDIRYVDPSDKDQFKPAREVVKPYIASAVDQEILKDKSNFRVFDVSARSGQEPTRAAYFHNSLTGYHAAKLGRYDELLDFHIYKFNLEVLNMLNTKYIIQDDEQGRPVPYVNDEANGNAWFIEQINLVATANQEIKALDSLSTKKEAVMLNNFDVTTTIIDRFKVDSITSIQLKEAKPNYLKYQSSNTNDGFAVFSEIYYKNGWNAYIDGKLEPHNRVNYVLRGMAIPKGNHTIEFKFEPKVVKTGSTIALGSSLLFVLLLIGAVYIETKKK